MVPERRAQQIEWRLLENPTSDVRSVADPTSAASRKKKDVVRNLTLQRGIVVDAIPYAHAYRVHLENLQPPLICTLGTGTSLAPIGAKAINTLVPGTPVIVSRNPQADFGVILAVEPGTNSDPALARSDWLSMSSRCGLHVDRAHEAVLRSKNAGGIQNWSNGRPIDSIPIGEYGAITETGLKLTLDSFMGQLAADEATGLFVFYHDQMARLAGVNLELFSSGHLEQFKDDDGEIRIYRGWTPYPWEQFGLLRTDADAAKSNTAQDVQNKTPWYGSFEPIKDDQIPFHRRQFWGGYLGQGGKDLIVAPPAENEDDVLAASTEGADQLPQGVLEEQRSLTGLYTLRSAKGIILSKQLTIPAAHPKARPEDLTGDTPDDYRPAGRGSDGAEHKVRADFEQGEDADPYQQIAGLSDRLAVQRNWEGLHPFAYHEKDFELAEEEDLPLAQDYEPPGIEKLGESHTAPPAKTASVKIDERYGTVSYHLNESSLSLLDDGSIVMRDGWGSEIVMSQGNIKICPAGDLVVQAGRNIINWAGRDAITRAKGCAEISTSDSDVRIKAEKNLHMLAGNSGVGGIMIESKGVDATDYIDRIGTDVVSGGIQLKATNGTLTAWSAELYFRSINAGTIFFDADQGNGRLLQLCQTADRYINISATDHFGPPAAVTASNMFTAYENTFGGSLISNGQILGTKGLVLRGDINVMQGHIYTETARNFQGLVGDYGPQSQATAGFKDMIQGYVKAMRTVAKEASKQYAGSLSNIYYKEGKAGNSETIAQVGFSFRDSKQYKAEDFKLWESSWQQILRETGTVTDRWVEPPVRIGGVETRPYPGSKRLADEDAYFQQPLSLYDVNSGVAKNRTDNRSAYEEPKFAEVIPVSIDGNYAVIDSTSPKEGTDADPESPDPPAE